MDINTYIKKHTTQSEFARLIGVSTGMVYQWQKGIRPISPEQCVIIESITNKKCSRKDLRPTDWESIWPELKDVA